MLLAGMIFAFGRLLLPHAAQMEQNEALALCMHELHAEAALLWHSKSSHVLCALQTGEMAVKLQVIVMAAATMERR